RYLERLDAEIDAVAGAYPGALSTVYFGGGTPSHLSDDELRRVFAGLQRGWGGASAGGTSAGAASVGGVPLAATELTLEADPLTFDAARLECFAALGVTRPSSGLQSTQDEVLKYLGRVHDRAEGLEAVQL